jgi:hypothetical protein
VNQENSFIADKIVMKKKKQLNSDDADGAPVKKNNRREENLSRFVDSISFLSLCTSGTIRDSFMIYCDKTVLWQKQKLIVRDKNLRDEQFVKTVLI